MAKLEKSSPKHIAIVIGTFMFNLLFTNFIVFLFLMNFPFLRECTQSNFIDGYEKTCTLNTGVAIFANIVCLVLCVQVAIFAYNHPERFD
ncbi:MAG: hypothetical protein RLZZ184_3620 [Cyanobacteriota bacterium]|jgi:hypothetical protein